MKSVETQTTDHCQNQATLNPRCSLIIISGFGPNCCKKQSSNISILVLQMQNMKYTFNNA